MLGKATSCLTICLCLSFQMEKSQDYSPVGAPERASRVFCNLKVKALLPLLLFPLLLYITCLRCTFRPLYVSYLTLFLKFPPKQSMLALWIFLFLRCTHSSICHTVLMCQHVAYCRVCFDLGFSKWGHQSSFIPKPQRPSRLQLLSPCSGSSDTDKSFQRRSGDVWADAWCTANAHSSVIVSVQGHHINDISMTRKKKLLVVGKECVRGGWWNVTHQH